MQVCVWQLVSVLLLVAVLLWLLLLRLLQLCGCSCSTGRAGQDRLCPPQQHV